MPEEELFEFSDLAEPKIAIFIDANGEVQVVAAEVPIKVIVDMCRVVAAKMELIMTSRIIEENARRAATPPILHPLTGQPIN